MEIHGLKLQGNGEYNGQCPFRENHAYVGSASFNVNLAKNRYHCFSCGAKGYASVLLRNQYGITVSEILEICSVFYSETESKPLPVDLKVDWRYPPKDFLDRGISLATLQKFRVGMYGDAITMPQYNSKKDLLGIVYRYPDVYRGDGVRVKRMESSKGFNKKVMLYGEHLITSFKEITIVEGNTDVYRLYDWGIQALGTQASSISEIQLNTLRQFDLVKVAVDNDKAGGKLRESIYAGLWKHTKVSFVEYEGKDPDSSEKDSFIKAHSAPLNYLTFCVNLKRKVKIS